jgi:hypothetical protein
MSAIGKSAVAVSVPPMLEQAMRRASTHYYRALNLPLDTFTEQAERAARLAVVCEDRARCWEALARWACSPGSGVPWALVSAVVSARQREDDAARFWRDTVRYWARAACGADPRDLDAEDLDLGRWAS